MSRQEIQYTIRQIPLPLDKKLRRRAKEAGTSLNQVVLEALKHQAGFIDEPMIYHDLDTLAGTWEDDAAFDEAIRIQHQIDPELWK